MIENMRRRRIPTVLTAILIGISALYIDVAVAQPAPERTEVQPGQDDGQWVEVEPTNLLPSDITGIYYLIPYRNRRDKWGQTVSFGYSSFNPSSLEPDQVAVGFDEIYSSAELPLIEIQGTIKRNFVLGSIGAELAVGIYQNKSDSDLVDSELRLIPVRLGANFSFDNLAHEPFVVPYAMAGGYIVFYEETSGDISFGGNTQVAPYYGIGLAFQLNWVDREAARISYLESGIENTFVFLEGRQFIASGAASDPDFSTGLDWGAGVRLEF
jgi:hypothetical protein